MQFPCKNYKQEQPPLFQKKRTTEQPNKALFVTKTRLSEGSPETLTNKLCHAVQPFREEALRILTIFESDQGDP